MIVSLTRHMEAIGAEKLILSNFASFRYNTTNESREVGRV